MLLGTVERELGEDVVSSCMYVVDDSVYKNKITRKGFADLTKLPSQELKSLISFGNLL